MSAAAARQPGPPAPPARLVPVHRVEGTLRYARTAYVRGEIDVYEFEDAVEHVLRGGLGNERFPFLPAFEALEVDQVSE